MFTKEQIITAHSKVKSGADFPSYIQEIKALGVINYIAYVSDGHTDYFGTNSYFVTIPAKYENLKISEETKIEMFQEELQAHQQGKTDYLTFIQMCAETGISLWEIDIIAKTCTYKNNQNNIVLIENIPV